MKDSSASSQGPALAHPSGTTASGQSPKGPQRTTGVVRTVLPHLLKLLPLLDGNVGSVVANLLNPPHPAPPPAPPVDLKPIEEGLVELKSEHCDLRAQLSDQNASIARVESRLELVEDASSHNTFTQKELRKELKEVSQRLEELKAAGHKATIFALGALCLLGFFVLLNVILLLYYRRILR